MKNILFFATLLLFFSSCKKDEFGNGFEISYQINIEVDAGISPLLSHSYTVQNIPTNLEANASFNNFTLDDLTRINSKFLRMDMVFPSGGNYSFIDRIYLEVSTDELGLAEIGYLEFIPNDEDGSISFIPAQTNLLDYLKGEYFHLTLRVEPGVPPPYTTSNRLDLTFHVFVEE